MAQKTEAYRNGVKACEAGSTRADNPYRKNGTQTQMIDWDIGFEARAERGFDVSHLPRKPFSEAFAL